MELFRSMRVEGDRPELDESSRTLGVRREDDPDALIDDAGFVHPGGGGMSVSSSPAALPRSRKSRAWGGRGMDPLWSMGSEHLGERLRLVADPPGSGHFLVEPAEGMLFDDYLVALHATRNAWKVVPEPKEDEPR